MFLKERARVHLNPRLFLTLVSKLKHSFPHFDIHHYDTYQKDKMFSVNYFQVQYLIKKKIKNYLSKIMKKSFRKNFEIVLVVYSLRPRSNTIDAVV